MVLLECKTELRKNRREFRQPMKQTRACFARANHVWFATNQTLAHFESNYNSYYSNYSSIRTSIVATIVMSRTY